MVAPSAASLPKFLSAPPGAVRGFLLYGSDGLQISARADALAVLLAKRSGPDAETIRLHDADIAAAPDRIALELNTGSLFGGTKIIALSALPAKAHAGVLQSVAEPFGHAFLIAQAPDLKKGHKLVQAFEAASHLAAIGCYGEDRDSLVASIKQHVSSLGCDIEDEAAALIAARCDFSTLLARSEAEKLVTYVGVSRVITAANVDECLIDQQTANLTEIVDHALSGEGRASILAFERFMAAEQNVTAIFVVLSSSLLRLHALKAAVDGGAPVMQAIKELRPPVFFKQQDVLAAQVRSWRTGALQALLSDLNGVLKETRLKPALAEDFTAAFLLRVAKVARSSRR